MHNRYKLSVLLKVVCGAITGLSLKLACYDISVDGAESEFADCIGSAVDQCKVHVCKCTL